MCTVAPAAMCSLHFTEKEMFGIAVIGSNQLFCLNWKYQLLIAFMMCLPCGEYNKIKSLENFINEFCFGKMTFSEHTSLKAICRQCRLCLSALVDHTCPTDPLLILLRQFK